MLGSSGEPLWPDGHGFAVCLTHDVDLIATAATPRQALRSMRTSLAGDAATARDRVVRLARPGVRAARALHHGLARTPTAETLELCVETERERGVTATYFFTAYPGAAGHRYDCVYEFDDPCRFGGERLSVAEVIRRLHDEGFDVGLHGSYNSALSPGRLAQEKQELERVLGLEVATTRQHFIHWDVRTTPGLQAAAGFAADSTLGFNRNIGYRAGTSLPFRWLDLERNEPLDLLEVPLVVHDGALLRTDALELDLELARSVLRRMIDAAAETAAAVTLLFHPNNLERAEHLELYRFALDYGLERGGWFTSLRDLNHWWRDREARLR